MVSASAIHSEMERAAEMLHSTVGEILPSVSISSLSPDEAVFLGQNISKLSPLVGNLIERRIPLLLAEHQSGGGLEWRRQDPDFPDAALFEADSPVGAGFEVKAWFPMATEITGRFRESQNLLAGKDIRVALIAWMLSDVIFGTPQIVGVLVVDAQSVACSRDRHYHNPPDYVCQEPQDTTSRTRNLQQTNVLGFKLQEQTQSRLCTVKQLVAKSPARNEGSETAAGQALSRELLAAATYRQDSNFAKIDRIDHRAIEEFKAQVLAKQFRERSIREWARTLRVLRGVLSEEPTPEQRRAVEHIERLYEGA